MIVIINKSVRRELTFKVECILCNYYDCKFVIQMKYGVHRAPSVVGRHTD